MLIVDDDGRTIRVHRGDEGTIVFNIPLNETEFYKFQVGDIIEFTVFEKNGYDKTPVVEKKIEISKETENVDIVLTKEDTAIGQPSNKVSVFWYEISLNGIQTTIGYDEDEKAAEFRILPAKA